MTPGLDVRFVKCPDCQGWSTATEADDHRCRAGDQRREREARPRWMPVYQDGVPVRLVWVEPR